MTLCAAGINKQSGINIIFAVSDMKLSFWSGAFSADGIAHKIKGLNDRWMVMIGGDVSAMVPLLDAVADAAQKDRKNTVRSFARRCSQAYREERKKIIETEILSQYDLSSYQEYLDLKPTGVTLFDAITKEIRAAEENWYLLFCGFDDDGEAHIFVITENGKIQFCDTEGFAAIGSGASAFLVAITAYPFSTWLRPGEGLYSMLAAKFAAEEAAEGVGEHTIALILHSDSRLVPAVPPEMIEATRQKWKKLPKIPAGCAEELERIVVGIHEHNLPYRRPRKGSKRRGSML